MAGPAADPGAAMEPVQGSSAPAEADQTDAGQVAVDLEDRLRRALADLENTRKRCERQVAESQEAERIRITQAWLPIVDNLDRALEYADAEPSAVIEGVRAVREQAVALLASLGFRRHDETDVPFDPQRHEAVRVVPDCAERAGTVLEIVRPGYGDGTRQLRPAAVVVAGGPG